MTPSVQKLHNNHFGEEVKDIYRNVALLFLQNLLVYNRDPDIQVVTILPHGEYDMAYPVDRSIPIEVAVDSVKFLCTYDIPAVMSLDEVKEYMRLVTTAIKSHIVSLMIYVSSLVSVLERSLVVLIVVLEKYEKLDELTEKVVTKIAYVENKQHLQVYVSDECFLYGGEETKITMKRQEKMKATLD